MEETPKQNLSESLLEALQQLLLRYQEQSQLNNKLLKENQQITTDLKDLKSSSQKKIKDIQEVCKTQGIINSQIEQLPKQLSAVKAPKWPIALNWVVVTIAIVCLGEWYG